MSVYFINGLSLFLHEIQQILNVRAGHPSEVDDVAVAPAPAPPEHLPEHGAAGGQHELVGAELPVLVPAPAPARAQQHVARLCLRPQLLERAADVGLEIIPLQAKLFFRHSFFWIIKYHSAYFL